MAGWSGLGAGAKALVLGGAAAVAAVAGAVVWQDRMTPDAAFLDASAPAEIAAAPAPAPAADVAQPAPAPSPVAPAATLPEPPSFDVVRVEPDGATLVAGRSGAGQEVAVLVDGAAAAVAEADPQGRFVVFLTLAPSTAARIMTLELRPAGGAAIPSEDQVLLAPNAAPEAIAAPLPEPVVAEPAAPSAEPVTQAEAPAAEVPAAEVSAATAVASPVPEGTDEPVVAAIAAPVAEPAAEATPAAAAPIVADLPPDQVPAPAAPPLAEFVPAPSVAPPVEPAPSVAVAVQVPAADPAPPATVAVQDSPAETAVAAVEPAPDPARALPEQAPEATAPTALLLSGNSVKVLQSAADEPADATGTVSIDAISYTVGGEVALSGRGAARAFVRLYLDNRALLETAIAEDGTWGGTLPVVAPGVYTLRADQVSATGQVTSRFETPFQREDPVVLAAPVRTATEGTARTVQGAVVPGPGRISITVQPGFTLWQIARENYGDGTLYVRVYDANKTLIRDPDLIYPGQVFSVPTGN